MLVSRQSVVSQFFVSCTNDVSQSLVSCTNDVSQSLVSCTNDVGQLLVSCTNDVSQLLVNCMQNRPIRTLMCVPVLLGRRSLLLTLCSSCSQIVVDCINLYVQSLFSKLRRLDLALVYSEARLNLV